MALVCFVERSETAGGLAVSAGEDLSAEAVVDSEDSARARTLAAAAAAEAEADQCSAAGNADL